VGHASRSCDLLRLEASHARVSQSSLKTGGGTTTGGARDIIAKIASRETEDGWVDVMGYIRLCYP
jgi:hypothetical protein